MFAGLSLFLKKYYKIIVKDLSKEQSLDANPKAIQPNNFIGNLDWDGNK